MYFKIDTKGDLPTPSNDVLSIDAFEPIKEQDFFVAIQEYLMQSLGLPYQVAFVSSGDMGKPDMRQIDIETWMPGEVGATKSKHGRYRETHSADYMGDYQARRLSTKVKRPNGEIEFVHTNDATAFAIGRTLIAILENNQTKQGTVRVPEVLVKYTGFSEIKR